MEFMYKDTEETSPAITFPMKNIHISCKKQPLQFLLKKFKMSSASAFGLRCM